MSTIKSSAENLTLNADGANNDVIIQSNGSTLVTVDGANGRVGIGGSPTNKLHIRNDGTTQRGDLRLGDAGGTTYWDIGRDNASTGDFTIFNQTDEKLRILSSGGLTFNGDTAAANALDDYEEGNWTPASTAFTIGSIQSAKYTKIGRQVTVQVYIEITNNSGNANGVVISGLPFNVANAGWSTGAVNMSDNNTVVDNLHVRAFSNSGDINVKKNNDTTMVGTEIDAGHFIFTVTYFTA